MLENQARKAERRMKRTIKKSATADSINLMEAFAEFIEEKEAQNKSAATIHNYKQSFEKYCAFNEFDDNTGIEEADQKAFLHWVNTMAQDLTPTTVNHYLRDVRTFLNWCMDEDRAYVAHLEAERRNDEIDRHNSELWKKSFQQEMEGERKQKAAKKQIEESEARLKELESEIERTKDVELKNWSYENYKDYDWSKVGRQSRIVTIEGVEYNVDGKGIGLSPVVDKE